MGREGVGLMLLGLLAPGCGGRVAARVDALLDDPGWYGEACVLALDRGTEAEATRVVEAHVDPAPTLSLHPVPHGQLGPSPTDTERWALVEGSLSWDRSVAPSVSWMVEAVGADPADPARAAAWGVCPPDACDADWVARAVGADARTPPPGGLFGALVEVGKLMLLPLTVTMDALTLPARLADPEVSAKPVTFSLLESLHPPTSRAPDGFPAVWSAPACDGVSPCTRRFVMVGTPVPDKAAPAEAWLVVRAVFDHAHCEAEAAWRVPLPPGPDLPSQLAALPDPVVLTPDRLRRRGLHGR